MRTCFNVQTSMNSPLEVDLALCKQVGFEEIEISFAKAKDFLEHHTLEELGQLVSDSGLKCASINAIFSISFCDDRKWQRVKDEFEFASDLANAVGCQKIIVLTDERADLAEDITEEAIFEDTVNIINRLADIAVDRGTVVALEPVGTMAIGSAAAAYKVVMHVNRPEVQLVIDDFNLFLWDLGSDYSDIASINKDKIAVVHVNDAEKMPFALLDQMHRCMPGDGRIDVQYYMKQIKKTGYDGTVSVEILNPSIWAKNPEIIIQEAYEKLTRFLPYGAYEETSRK